MDDRWLSVDEIADYLGVAKDTIYTWVTSKGMPGHKVGRFWKFKKRRRGRLGTRGRCRLQQR
jgi:excisionase family DNA binding protein